MTSKPKVTLVTCASMPNLFHGEEGLPDELAQRGCDPRIAVWNDPDVDWDDAGMVVDSRSPETLEVDPYRGANANMHTVEALLGAYAATGHRLHLERALRITSRICKQFEAHDFRLPEHYDESWSPLLDYNRDVPADAFRPFGSTIGHWLERSLLMVEVRTACAAHTTENQRHEPGESWHCPKLSPTPTSTVNTATA